MDRSAVIPIQLQASNLRPIAYRVLSKKHGLNVQTDALKILTETIGFKFGSEWKGAQSQLFLEDIARVWKAQDRGLFIDGAGLNQVISELAKSSSKSSKLSFAGFKNSTESTLAGRSDTFTDDAAQSEEIAEDAVLNWRDYFKVTSAEKQPRYQFDRTRKQFSHVATVSNDLRGNLEAKVDYFLNRYSLLEDRLSRNENFQKPGVSSSSSFHKSFTNTAGASHEISLIKNLLGRDGQKFILFGLLSQNSNGDYTLEDSTDRIEINITQALQSEGSYYCCGMFVVVEGIYSASGGTTSATSNSLGGCFHVSNMGHPPAERRDHSLEHYGNLDFMGLHDVADPTSVINYDSNHIVRVDKQFKKKLVLLERQLDDHRLIFMGGDCYLDKPKTMEGLTKFFNKLENKLQETSGYEPIAIVLSGSFVSIPLIATNMSSTSVPNSASYKGYFDALANLISKYPTIVSSIKFVLIPGSNDPWQSTFALGGSSSIIFPQTPIPNLFTNRLARVLPKGNLLIGSNPIRLNYLSQEIVIMRDDITQKLKRNDMIFETELETERENLEREKQREIELLANGEDDEVINIEDILGQNQGDSQASFVPTKIKQARKLVKTILDQGNLQPFNTDLKIVKPAYEHTVRLEPLPTILILNDSTSSPFEVTYNGCKVVNNGLLIGGARKLNYSEYHPSTKKFHFKEVYF